MRRLELQPPAYRDLQPTRMSCDRPITTKNDIRAPFHNCSHSMLISGRPGSGKSSFLLSLLRKQPRIYYKAFSAITFCCPAPSRASAKDSPLADLDDEPDSVFDTFDLAAHERVLQTAKAFRGTPRSQLLIIDDCAASLKENEHALVDLLLNRRHLQLTVWVVSQYITLVPRAARSNIGMVVAYNPSAQEHATLHREFLSQLSNEEYKQVRQFVWGGRATPAEERKHQYLIADTESGAIYKGLQRIEML